MRILFSGEKFVRGGAANSIRVLLTELAKDHEVTAIYCGDVNEKKTVDGIEHIVRKPPTWVNMLRSTPRQTALDDWWTKELRDNVLEPHDYVLTQQTLTPSSTQYANTQKALSVIFIRDYYPLCLKNNPFDCFAYDEGCEPCLTTTKKLLYPWNDHVRSSRTSALVRASHIVYNSPSTQAFYEKTLGVKGTLIYPTICDGLRQSPGGDSVGFVNKRGPDKGGDLVADLVGLRPKTRFLVAGHRLPGKQSPNVEYLGYVEDMQSFYDKLRVLLVPSQWMDPSPKVLMEAMACGVPVIASNIGGIPGVLDGAGELVDDYSHTKSWLNSMYYVNANETVRDNMIRRGLHRSMFFRPRRQVEKLRGVLGGLKNGWI